MDIEYAQEWYTTGMTHNGGLLAIPNNRIFLFKGKNGQGGEMTTTEEISAWISGNLPHQNFKLKSDKLTTKITLERQRAPAMAPCRER